MANEDQSSTDDRADQTPTPEELQAAELAKTRQALLVSAAMQQSEAQLPNALPTSRSSAAADDRHATASGRAYSPASIGWRCLPVWARHWCARGSAHVHKPRAHVHGAGNGPTAGAAIHAVSARHSDEPDASPGPDATASPSRDAGPVGGSHGRGIRSRRAVPAPSCGRSRNAHPLGSF